MMNQFYEFFFIFFLIYIYFWLCWVFIAVCKLPLVGTRGGYSLLQCAGFSLRWLLLLRSTGSRHVGFSSCGTWAQQLWLAGLVAPRHVGSSQTRAQTCVPCIGRRILNHCFTKEAPSFMNSFSQLMVKKGIILWEVGKNLFPSVFVDLSIFPFSSSFFALYI